MKATKSPLGEAIDRAKLDRAAEERSENEGMTEHPHKAEDPRDWELGRLARSWEPEEPAEAIPLPGPTPITFRVERRDGVWEVRKDEKRFGDYRVEPLAIAAAETAVREIIEQGGYATLRREQTP